MPEVTEIEADLKSESGPQGPDPLNWTITIRSSI